MASDKLTNAQVKAVRSQEKSFRLADGKRMYLLVKPSGAKCWRLDFEHNGKRRTASLGTYPETSLAEARKRRDEARALIANGQDPIEHKRKSRKTFQLEKFKFEEVVTDWLERIRAGKSRNVITGKQSSAWAPSTYQSAIDRINYNLLPYLGNKHLNVISISDIDACLDRMVNRGATENARKTMILIKQFYRDETVCEIIGKEDAMSKIGRNVPGKKRRPNNHAAVTTPNKLAEILRLMDSHKGTLVVNTALQLTPHLILRPGELRHLRWVDLNIQQNRLVIPAQRFGYGDTIPNGQSPQRGLKSGDVDLIVPLSTQAKSLLEEIHSYTGQGGYIFPSSRSKPESPLSRQRPMSENAINLAMRSVNISKDTQTAHGFRATARTLISEQLRYPAEVIERQLNHNKVDEYGNAYARMEFIEQRSSMMQSWSDYLDELKLSPQSTPT